MIFVSVVYLVDYVVVYSALDSDDSGGVAVGLGETRAARREARTPHRPEMEKEGAIVDASDGEENNGRPQRQRNPPAKLRENEVIHVSTRAASLLAKKKQSGSAARSATAQGGEAMDGEAERAKTRCNRRCKSR